MDDNRTRLEIDFLEAAGIMMNVTQLMWSFIEYQFNYETAVSRPDHITAVNPKTKLDKYV